jgi:uncharacterized FlgJ-related protein
MLLTLTANLSAPITDKSMQSVLDTPAKTKIQQELMRQKALNEPFSVELFYNVLKMHVNQPDIVLRQALLETGWFTSKSFTKGNNFAGMKLPQTRCTLATGSVHGHAKYTHWYYCVIDYKKWQRYYNVQDLTEKQYYTFLNDLPYAESKNYVRTLKSINPKT